MTAPKFRPLKFGVTRVSLRDGVPGTHYLKADQELQAFPDRLTDRLQHWASIKPQHSFMARRMKQADGTLGDWQHVTYALSLRMTTGRSAFRPRSIRPCAMLRAVCQAWA